MTLAVAPPTREEARAALAGASLEWLVTERESFALTTPTPVQRAFLRAVEGRPLGELGRNRDVLEAFGGRLPEPGVKPHEVVLLGAVRGGKSLFSAATACRWSQLANLSKTRAGEVPRINILSLDKDKADVVLNDHLLGSVRDGGGLVSALYHGRPHGDSERESVLLLHPSGRPIEVRVIAGQRAGGSLVSRWSAGTVFDEATRMLGADEHVINLEESRKAALGRTLDGTQLWYVGSPYAPVGPVYDMFSKHWGNPSRDFLVVKAPGPSMNPAHWTPERCEELLRRDPDAYRTDVLAEFLTPTEALFSHVALANCTRKDAMTMPRQPGIVYCAAMDSATRGNSWTLVIAGQIDGVRTVVHAEQWTGSTAAPLSSAAVLHEVAKACHRYGITSVWSDRWSLDANRDLASQSGLILAECRWTEVEKAKKWFSLRSRVVEATVSLPPHPTLLADLRRVQRKATSNGVKMHLPETGDGRHCDFAPAVVMALENTPVEREPEAKPHPDVIRMRKADAERFARGD